MIHKTKKEEGKKHITMPLRWEFRLFQPDSMPIFACFGRFRLVSTVSVAGRYDPIWPIQPDSGRFSANRSRFGMNRATTAQIKPSRCESEEKKKKKNLDVAPTGRQPHQMPHPAWGRVGRKCGTLLAAFVLSRLQLRFLIVVNKSLINLVYNLFNF